MLYVPRRLSGCFLLVILTQESWQREASVCASMTAEARNRDWVPTKMDYRQKRTLAGWLPLSLLPSILLPSFFFSFFFFLLSLWLFFFPAIMNHRFLLFYVMVPHLQSPRHHHHQLFNYSKLSLKASDTQGRSLSISFHHSYHYYFPLPVCTHIYSFLFFLLFLFCFLGSFMGPEQFF